MSYRRQTHSIRVTCTCTTSLSTSGTIATTENKPSAAHHTSSSIQTVAAGKNGDSRRSSGGQNGARGPRNQPDFLAQKVTVVEKLPNDDKWVAALLTSDGLGRAPVASFLHPRRRKWRKGAPRCEAEDAEVTFGKENWQYYLVVFYWQTSANLAFGYMANVVKVWCCAK